MNEREKLNDKLMGEIGAMSDEEFAQGMQRIHDLMRGRSAKVRERELLLEQARALVKKYNVPATLEADWEFTNHYELTDEGCRKRGESYFWLDVESVFFLPEALIDCGKDFSATEEGKRLGYCLETAVLLAKLVAALEEE